MRHTLLSSTALAALLAVTTPTLALADAETEALRAQVKLLEKRLEQLEKKQAAAPAAAPKTSYSAAPQIENRVAILERKQELAVEDAKAKAEKNPNVEIGSKGFALTSADKQYSLRMRAYAQASSRSFLDNSNTTSVNTFTVRSARPIIEAKMTDYFNGRIMLDFGGGNTRLLDAYMDFKPDPQSRLATLRLGKFKVPLGIERWQSEQELLFAERGQTTNLVPFRDVGAMLLGEVIPDQLEYQISVGNGAADIGDPNTDTDNHRELTGRIFAHPLRWSDLGWARGLGLGVAGSVGKHTGTTAAPGLTTGYVTMGLSRYFTYNGTSVANGDQWRVNPQAYYYNGPFSLLGEYISNGQKLRNGTTDRVIKNDAWNAIATYVLTGEDASFDGVKPANSFDWKNGHWGAFEVAGRAGMLNVDDDVFPTFASLATSAKQASETSVGINWYLNNSVKLNLDYAVTKFDGGAAGGADRETEKAVLTQAQFRF